MSGVIFNIEEAVKNSKFNVLQEPVRFILDNEMEAFEKESLIDMVFVKKTSDRYREEFRSTTAMGNFKPTEDMEPAGITDFEEGYNKQFVFQTWTNSIVVSKQTMEDGNTTQALNDMKTFIKSWGRTREIYAANFIAAGLGKVNAGLKITAQSGLGMDTVDGTVEGTKQQYFHNAHKPAGYNASKADRNYTQSNKFHATVKWDGTDVLLYEKVMDVVEQVASIMRNYVDDRNNILTVEPTRIVIGEDYLLKNALMTALKSKFGSPMSANGSNLSYGAFELKVDPYLSKVDGFEKDDHAMLLIDPQRNEEGLGLVWWDRIPLTVRSYIDQKTEANVFAGRGRFGCGFGDFRAMSYINLGGTETTNSTEITPIVSAGTQVQVVGAVTTKAQA